MLNLVVWCTDIVNFEDHSDNLCCKKYLLFLRQQSLDNVLISHICNKIFSSKLASCKCTIHEIDCKKICAAREYCN